MEHDTWVASVMLPVQATITDDSFGRRLWLSAWYIGFKPEFNSQQKLPLSFLLAV
jgi:hypothetical protein